MGAEIFMVRTKAKTAEAAFDAAVTAARARSGRGGYSGTVAEKRSFVVIALPKTEPAVTAVDYANRLLDEGDPRVDDKWGPAGIIADGPERWLIFGWASS